MTLGDNLLRFNKAQKYLIYDLETEGLNKAFSRPYQVSFVTFTLEKILEQHNHYIWWPDLKVSEGAAAKTRFDYRDYKTRAEDARKILEKFESYINDPSYLILGHNTLGYDCMIHQVWRKALGLPKSYETLDRYIDTGALAKAHQKRLKPDRENFQAWQVKMLSMREGVKWKLGFLAKEFKIPFEEARLHDALYDVLLNIEIFKKLVWTFDI